jgi:diacylglycerol kinase (ATP)
LKQNILFIINPISGGKSKAGLPGIIDGQLDRSQFSPNYAFTEYAGHAAEIAEEALQKSFDVIVAVGGDGTINEIASVVKKYGKTLGIVPFGSGNGLARFLKIPMDTRKAIQLLNNYTVKCIDTAVFNGKDFYNIAGVGFDAHISSVFASDKGRGLAGYVRLGLKEVLRYKPAHYKINIDGKIFERKAYAVSIANSSQYGNNAYISPHASVTDGLLDVCIIKAFPIYKLPLLAFYVFGKKTDQTEMVEIIQGKDIQILRAEEGAVHIDGEPFFMNKEIKVYIEPLSLNVIVPD